MKLPKLAIENSAFILIIVLIGLSIGTLSYVNMPRSEDPALDFPLFVIVAIYPGTTPKDMEELVVDPIEDRLNELEDVTEIRTTIQEGIAIIRTEGEFGENIDDLFDEVQAKVNSTRSDLPDDLFSLEVRKIQPLDVKILQLGLISDALPYRDLVDLAEELEKSLEKVDGVRSVDIDGYPEEEVRIALDMEKMARFNLPLNQVAGIVQGNNANIPGGNLKAGAKNFTLKTSGGYQSIEELRNTVVSARGESIIRLGDIANIFMGYEDPKYLARHNGKRVVFVSVTQKKGKNILKIAEELKTKVHTFEADLPPSVELVSAFEQGPAVKSRINDFFLNLIQGILLVGAVILLFLGIRNSLIVMTVIPTSIIIAIYLLDVSGFGLQQISIAGLVLALGLLVDNGIVVIENIHRYLKDGFGLIESAYKGTAEVGWALVSSTATTVLAFFPITQLGGGTGDFIKSLPLTVIFSLIASLLLALAFTPLLASKLMKEKVDEKLNFMERFMEGLVNNVYRRALNFSLARPWIMIVIAVTSLAGSIALFPLVGVSFFPTADKPLMLVDIETPQGTSIEKTNEAALFVESVLDTTNFITDYTMNVGHGNPQIYYNVRPREFSPNYAQVLVNLEAWDPNRFYPLVYHLRETFSAYPGAKIKVQELKNGPPSEAPVAIKIMGDDLDTLKTLATQLEGVIANVPGIINLDNPLSVSKTNLKTQINRDKAAMVGVQLADIDLAIRTAFTGNSLGTMNMPDGKKYPMVARMAQGNDARVSDFQRISVASRTGAQIPLGQIARLEFEAGATRIDHYDLERTVTVKADVLDTYNVTQVTQEIIGNLDKIALPKGYDFYIAGEYETQQESFGDLGQMLIVAILGIFAVLVLQFKSFKQPFVVLSAIPLAFSGSVVALYLSGYSFSFLAFIGFTSLVGIVVNTSIILVDYSNQLVAKGLSVRDALQQASETRFKPIILTTLTTIFGLLPLTLSGSNLWSPLGWTIIGGMVSSTLLTLLIVPILYRWLTEEKEELA